eukprot:16792-Rhodomonas_salina.2
MVTRARTPKALATGRMEAVSALMMMRSEDRNRNSRTTWYEIGRGRYGIRRGRYGIRHGRYGIRRGRCGRGRERGGRGRG